jgi:3-hydroxybutyrate dehydrogenase
MPSGIGLGVARALAARGCDIALNLTSAFHTARLALPSMKSGNWGRIISISSTHGLVAFVEKSAYVAAAKHGIVGLTKVIALEPAQTGVTCNAICPRWVLTPLIQKQIDTRVADRGMTPAEAAASLLGEKRPSRQFVTTEQAGELAGFLRSPAVDQVRGVAWAMDGG